MKTKQLLLLSVLALTVLACPNDDDNPPAENPIVGTWKFLESFENGIQEDIEPCDTENTIVFEANGSLSAEYYVDDNEDGTCELEDAETGTWSNTGSLYTITIDGEVETDEVTFEGNTFFIEETDTEDGMTYTYKYVFIKQ